MLNVLALLLALIAAPCAAESGLVFHPSSATAVGGLAVPSGVMYVGTTSKPADESYYNTWLQGGVGILSTQPVLSGTAVFAIHDPDGHDVLEVKSNGELEMEIETISTNRLATFRGERADSWLNLVVQNTSSGTAASGDIQVFSDVGSEDFGYIDMGIQSSGYSDPEWSFAGPGDGYLFVVGGSTRIVAGDHYDGDLSIGTKSSGTAVNFFIGGTTHDDLKVTISTEGVVLSSHTALVLPDSTRISSRYDLATVSTATLITSYTTSQTSGLSCMTGSTLTWVTVSTASFQLNVGGTLTKAGGSGVVSSSFLVNGSFVLPTSATNGYIDRSVGTGDNFPLNMVYTTQRLFPPGVHTACIAVWNTTGSISIKTGGVVSFGVAAFRQ